MAAAFITGCQTLPSQPSHPSADQNGATHSQSPFADQRAQPTEYVGPGRELAPPASIETVAIGWFGPSDSAHPTAGLMWQAACLAIEDANAAGGYNGAPFRLVFAWSENPWGSGIAGLARLVYDDDVWAITGAPDGPSAHLAAQIVAKARLPFVSPVATDQSTNLAAVPWVFSCESGNHVQVAPLASAVRDAAAVCDAANGSHVAVISCTDHDSRLLVADLLAELHGLEVHPAAHLQFQPGDRDFTAALQHLDSLEPAAVVIIAGPLDGARFVQSLRAAGLTAPVFGGPSFARQAFLVAAGAAAEGTVFPLSWAQSGPGARSAEFARRFRARFGVEPDASAARTYDALNLLIAAIRQAGLNRALIRDAVRGMSPWNGASGSIAWDATGQNSAPVGLGVVRQGKVVPLSHDVR